jgi:hypothetical protein
MQISRPLTLLGRRLLFLLQLFQLHLHHHLLLLLGWWPTIALGKCVGSSSSVLSVSSVVKTQSAFIREIRGCFSALPSSVSLCLYGEIQSNFLNWEFAARFLHKTLAIPLCLLPLS